MNVQSAPSVHSSLRTSADPVTSGRRRPPVGEGAGESVVLWWGSGAHSLQCNSEPHQANGINVFHLVDKAISLELDTQNSH